MTALDPATIAPKEPILARDETGLPDELPRGASIPADLDPLAEGILMLHQKEWLEDTSDLKIAEKGRRTGITFAEALDDTLIAAASRSAGGDNVFYIGDTKDKGREFIGYVAHFAKVIAGELHQVEEFLFEDKRDDGTSRMITAYRITFASGYRVEALSSNPANIRGLQGVVGIDEAAFHSDVREVIDAARRVTGHAIPERIAPRRPGDPPELVSGGSRAFELLGWRPRRSALEDILADAWRFHRAHPSGFSS